MDTYNYEGDDSLENKEVKIKKQLLLIKDLDNGKQKSDRNDAFEKATSSVLLEDDGAAHDKNISSSPPTNLVSMQQTFQRLSKSSFKIERASKGHSKYSNRQHHQAVANDNSGNL